MWIVVDEILISTFIFNTRLCTHYLLLQQQLGKRYQEDCIAMYALGTVGGII